MISRLDLELETLQKYIIEMGALCEGAITNATKAVLTKDVEAADLCIKTELKTNQKERDIEDLCLKILLRQQPVATDLRIISSALKMITDLERIADQSRDISEISKQIDFTLPLDSIEKMANGAMKMVTSCIDCYVNSDLDGCKKVFDYDDKVDKFFYKIRDEIVTVVSSDPSKTLEGMYILMIAKYFERIGDHATNIAEWVEFSITGKHKGDDA